MALAIPAIALVWAGCSKSEEIEDLAPVSISAQQDLLEKPDQVAYPEGSINGTPLEALELNDLPQGTSPTTTDGGVLPIGPSDGTFDPLPQPQSKSVGGEGTE